MLQSKTWRSNTMYSDSGVGETYFPSYDIPEPPSEPPPEPPTDVNLKSSLSYNDDSLKSLRSVVSVKSQKKVRFSNTDDIWIRSPTLSAEMAFFPATLVSRCCHCYILSYMLYRTLYITRTGFQYLLVVFYMKPDVVLPPQTETTYDFSSFLQNSHTTI